MLTRAGALARSMLVGAAATIVDLSALFVLVTLLGVPARVASIPALVLSGSTVFFGNRRFAFAASEGDGLRQAARFACVHAVTLVVNAFVFDVAMRVAGSVVPYWAARLAIGSFVYFTWSFPMLRRTFSGRRSARAPHRGCTSRGTPGRSVRDPQTQS